MKICSLLYDFFYSIMIYGPLITIKYTLQGKNFLTERQKWVKINKS